MNTILVWMLFISTPYGFDQLPAHYATKEDCQRVSSVASEFSKEYYKIVDGSAAYRYAKTICIQTPVLK